jgi:membrane associated rhomboid family serine protease
VSEHPPAGTQETATCYRHPDREAHIRCARCDRRICPDCMVSASVGFQCPECVREGNKGVRRARTVFGGRITDDPGYVSKALIALNALVFLGQNVLGRSVEHRFWLVGGPTFDPLLLQSVGVADGEYYRLLTAAFLHGGVLHLVLNMYALFLFGPVLERGLGRVRFTALYLLSAVGGTAVSYALGSPGQPSLGASGAVFGLMGAFLVVGRRLGTDPRAVLVLLAVNFAFGFLYGGRIDWRAHLGGLVTGVLVALVLAHAPRTRRVAAQLVGLLVVATLLAALVAWRTATLLS